MSKQVIFTHDIATKNRSLVDSIKGNLQHEGAVIKEKTVHQAYDQNLPEGLTPEIIKELSHYNGTFANATRVAIGEMAAEIFNADKEVNRVEGSVGYFAHGDSMNVTVDRTRKYVNPKTTGEDDKTVTKHLVITDSFELKGASYKSLKDSMSTEFANTFSK